MAALQNMPGVGPKMQVVEDESGKLPDVLVTRLQGTHVVVAHAQSVLENELGWVAYPPQRQLVDFPLPFFAGNEWDIGEGPPVVNTWIP
ncbi:hypothetical protein CDL15_Pgr021104 [Punica granatum]|uniref:Uncharacterized protein n=1 Tax=Punica granatum TaxID=22663 RepID=A0A218WJV4_PUNGR|nr:hypothetical protein CDL15_Pgr021104 [Punica granatum]